MDRDEVDEDDEQLTWAVNKADITKGDDGVFTSSDWMSG